MQVNITLNIDAEKDVIRKKLSGVLEADTVGGRSSPKALAVDKLLSYFAIQMKAAFKLGVEAGAGVKNQKVMTTVVNHNNKD